MKPGRLLRRHKLLAVITVLLFLALNMLAQSRGTCDSIYNTFLTSNQLPAVKAIVDTIYPNGRIYYKRDSTTNFVQLLGQMGLDNDITFEPVKEFQNRLVLS